MSNCHPARLRQDRYDPANLEYLEHRRWICVMKTRTILRDMWNKFISMIPTGNCFYGHDSKGRTVYFKNDRYGLSHDYVEENCSSPEKFVSCLPDDDLPMYVNSIFPKVKETVAMRMRKDPDVEIAPLREDIAAIYFRIEKISKNLYGAIGLYNDIIQRHFYNLYNNMVLDFRFERSMISLVINHRTYVFKDGNFVITPEGSNTMFLVSDLLREDKLTPDNAVDRLSLPAYVTPTCFGVDKYVRPKRDPYHFRR